MIAKGYSHTLDIELFKDDQNRLERPREMAVGVRHCRFSIFTGFCKKKNRAVQGAYRISMLQGTFVSDDGCNEEQLVNFSKDGN